MGRRGDVGVQVEGAWRPVAGQSHPSHGCHLVSSSQELHWTVVGSPEVGFLVGPWVLAPAPVPGSYHPSRHCGGRGWFLWSQRPCLTPVPGPNLGLICTEHEMGPDRHTGLIPILGDGLADDPCVCLLLASQSAGQRCGLGVECKSGFTVYFTATVQTFSVSAIFMCSFI